MDFPIRMYIGVFSSTFCPKTPQNNKKSSVSTRGYSSTPTLTPGMTPGSAFGCEVYANPFGLETVDENSAGLDDEAEENMRELRHRGSVTSSTAWGSEASPSPVPPGDATMSGNRFASRNSCLASESAPSGSGESRHCSHSAIHRNCSWAQKKTLLSSG